MSAGGSRGDALLARLSRRTSGGRWIPEIDGLRFLAIALVVADHAAIALNVSTHASVVEAPFGAASQPNHPDPAFTLFGRGSVGVLVFFMVSGFVLALPFIRNQLSGAEPVALRRYLLRRVTRIEPPYLIVMTLLFAGSLVAGSGVGLGHFVASLFYLHGTYYGTDSPLNSVAWSLEIEVQFYLLVPALAVLLCAGRRRVRRQRIIAIVALAIACRAFGLMTAYTFLGSSIQFFLLGWLLADIYVEDWAEAPPSARVWDVVGFATMPALLVIVPTRWGAAVLPLLVFVLGYSIFRGIALRRLLSDRWIATVGGMCYSIYLVHYPLFILLSRSLRPFATLPSSAALIVACALLMPAALVVGGIFFVLVERPCMDPLWFDRALARLRLAVRRWPRMRTDEAIRIPDSAIVDTELPRRSVELVDG
jgi:peptidoglycan/LPS O-acetylase OafA/YrhL